MGQKIGGFRRLTGSLLRGGLLGLVLLGPMIVGVVPSQYGDGVYPIAVGAVLGFSFAVLWFLSGSNSARSQVIVVVVASCLLTVTLLDVVARPLLEKAMVPNLIVDWPPMPLSKRYLPNVRFTGTISGEMARDSFMKRYREYRDGSFTTDRFGFRNEGTPNEPLDVIVLGDSYGMGDDTAQSQTWPTLLSRTHGLRVYNLSMAGYGPWQEYIDLMLEVDRLKLRPQGTVVLWMIFTGNDLEDPCFPGMFRKEQLPWRRGFIGFVKSIRSYQNQSLLRILWRRIMRNYAGGVSYTGIVVKPFLDGTAILFDREYAREAERSLDGVREHEHYACLRQTLAAMRRFADSKHLTVAILMAPPKEEVYAWVLHDGRPWPTTSSPSGFASAIREMAREEHMPFVDMKPALVQASERVYRTSQRLLYWRDDSHWNVEGNREAATIAYNLYLSVISGKPPQ